MIDSSAIAKALSGIAAHTATASEELCSADGALGDGDLGITVSKGFAEAAETELPDDVGKGNLGDKTVLDSLDAIAEALEGAAPETMVDTAITAAGDAVEQFRNQPNRLGRARMFGEKSIGLADPGQLAFLRIVEGLKYG